MTEMGLERAEGAGHRNPKPLRLHPPHPGISVLLHPHLQRARGGYILTNSKSPAVGSAWKLLIESPGLCSLEWAVQSDGHEGLVVSTPGLQRTCTLGGEDGDLSSPPDFSYLAHLLQA